MGLLPLKRDYFLWRDFFLWRDYFTWREIPPLKRLLPEGGSFLWRDYIRKEVPSCEEITSSEERFLPVKRLLHLKRDYLQDSDSFILGDCFQDRDYFQDSDSFLWRDSFPEERLLHLKRFSTWRDSFRWREITSPEERLLHLKKLLHLKRDHFTW
jgi:hypothetical protein